MPHPAINRAYPQRQPGRAHQENHVAVLKQNRLAKGVAERTEPRPRPADAPVAQEQEHRNKRQRGMHHNVDPRTPRIRQYREHELPGIKDCGSRVPHKRHSGVFLLLPKRPPASIPLFLHALVKRVVVMTGVPKSELPVLKEHWPITRKEQRTETQEDKDACCVFHDFALVCRNHNSRNTETTNGETARAHSFLPNRANAPGA